MSKARIYDDDKLNMFIDGELDADETNELHEVLLNQPELRERACQLKAVRDLVAYAYQTPPEIDHAAEECDANHGYSGVWKSIAACMLLCFGVVIGWSTHQYGPDFLDGSPTAANVLSYYSAQKQVASHSGGRYVLHLSTSNYSAVKTALDDADNLIASYKRSHTPLKIDIITDHTGIDVLRMDVSPYRARIEKLLKDNRNVISLYACAQSLSKAKKKEGHNLIMLPGTKVDKRANELIPKRLDDGWVYIKA